jgi:hypothetical protein
MDFTSQDRDDNDTQVIKAFCMAVEDSSAAGMDTGPRKGNEIVVSSKPVRKTTLLPIGLMTVATIQGQTIRKPLKVLFDSGSMVKREIMIQV